MYSNKTLKEKAISLLHEQKIKAPECYRLLKEAGYKPTDENIKIFMANNIKYTCFDLKPKSEFLQFLDSLHILGLFDTGSKFIDICKRVDVEANTDKKFNFEGLS